MKRKSTVLSIVLLGVFLLTASTVSQGSSWLKLQEELDPEGKKFWTIIANTKTSKVIQQELQRRHVDSFRYSFKFLAKYEGLIINSGYPVVTGFSPDQVILEVIPEKYHSLFILSIDELEKILAEGECVIVSQKVKIAVVRKIPEKKRVISKTEEESSQTLIAAPNEKSLKKAITRFFGLEEIPLEPIIWKTK